MRFSRASFVCLIALGLAATACTNTTSGGSGTKCSTNTDCKAPTSLCATATGLCVECLGNADCADGKVCTDGACKTPTPGTGCASCKSSEYCFNDERCVDRQTDCAQDQSACLATEECLGISDSEAFCFTKCNPTRNNADNTNTTCWGGWGICLGYSQTDQTLGACLPPMLQKNKLGDVCLSDLHPTEDAYFDCKQGLVCVPDPTGQGPKTCKTACALSKGTDTNTDCEGNGCVPVTETLGFCDSQPNINAAGEECGGTDPNQPNYGGCKNGLACAEVLAGHTVCATVCNPYFQPCANAAEVCFTTDPSDMFGVGYCFDQKKTQAVGQGCLVADDPFAPEWNNCVDLSPCVAHVCGALQTKNRDLNQTCGFQDPTDPGYNACKDGLFCLASRCVKNCTADATPTGCSASETCVPLRGGGAVCLAKCDPANGTSTNTTCTAGDFCYGMTGTYAPGLCVPLSPPEFGTQTLGAECGDPDAGGPGWCNSKQGLFCNGGTCAKACDPRVTPTTDCDVTTQECSDEAAGTSFKGGICLAIPSQHVDELCDGVTQRCTTGLGCSDVRGDGSLMLCETVCDPNVTPSTCAAGSECIPLDFFGDTGACLRTPTATRTVEQVCLSGDPREAAYENCATGLSCLDLGANAICLTDCNPQTTPTTCPANNTCEPISQTDPTLGVCFKERTTTQTRYQQCFGSDPNAATWNDCDPQFICVGMEIGFCLDICAPSASNPASTCGSNWYCAELQSGDGVCLQKCTATAQCTNYTPTTCDDPVGFGFDVCL